MKKLFDISNSEKNRILEMHESATKRLYLKEQYEDIRQGGPGDPYQYAKKDGKYFYAKKGTENWIEQKNQKGIDSIKSAIYGEKVQQTTQPDAQKPKPDAQKPKPDAQKPKPDAQKPKPDESPKQYCPYINQNSKQIVDINNIYQYYKKELNLPTTSEGGLWKYINNLIDERAEIYFKTIKDNRISCQIALNGIRPLVRTYNLIVVDTLHQFIYLFDPNGNFIAKDAIISGKNKQSTDPKTIANAMLSWEDMATKAGFKWVSGKGYVDQTGKNRQYNHEIVYSWADKNKTRFTSPGIFDLGTTTSDSEYAGGANNVKNLVKGNEEVANAIHGYYIEQPRTVALQKARKFLGDVKNPEAKKSFIDAVSSGGLNLDMSYGCINVTVEFLNILRKYWNKAKVFVLSESTDNYLVDNPENYFDKMMNNTECPSPDSLGAQYASNFPEESEENFA
jgi:hypothetical protein